MMQDDSIIVFFAGSHFVFILTRKRWYLAAAAFGFGTMTNYFLRFALHCVFTAPEIWKEGTVVTIGFSIGIARHRYPS